MWMDSSTKHRVFQALRLRIYERTENMIYAWICQSTYKLRVPTLWDLQAGNQDSGPLFTINSKNPGLNYQDMDKLW
jgi:hypothetical protein